MFVGVGVRKKKVWSGKEVQATEKSYLVSLQSSIVHCMCALMALGAIHTSELDRSEIGLSPKRSKCERSNAN